MRSLLVASLLSFGLLASCAPSASTGQMVTVTPVLVKVSDPAPRGGTLTIQGRYLGGANQGVIRLGADENGKGGYVFPASAIKSWTDSEIVASIPTDAPVGGSWLFVEVSGKQSTGLPFSVTR